MNKYHSFYLADIEALIRYVALEELMVPPYTLDHEEDAQARIQRVAYYNDGIKSMANYLIDAFRAKAEEGSTDE